LTGKLRTAKGHARDDAQRRGKSRWADGSHRDVI
jgi:hypothetical protein